MYDRHQTGPGSGSAVLSRSAILIAIAIACAAFVLGMTGCSSQTGMDIEDKPKTASEYMVDLNDYSGRLQAKMQELAEAAGEGKISAMQTKAQEAYAMLDEMADLEAPDEISEIKNQYNDAATQLKGALNDYMTLYTELYDSADSDAFDYSTYVQRLEDIQKQYDSALGVLEDADKKASEM